MISKNIYTLTFVIPSMVTLICANCFLFCVRICCATSILSVINKYVLLGLMIISLVFYGFYLQQSYIRNKLLTVNPSRFKILLTRLLAPLFFCFPFALSLSLALSHVFHYSWGKLYIIVLFILLLITISGVMSFSVEKASQYFFVNQDQSIYVPIFQNPGNEQQQENGQGQKDVEMALNPHEALQQEREVLRSPPSNNVENSDNVNIKSWEANISWSSYSVLSVGLIGYTYLVFKAVADLKIKIIVYILIAYMFCISSFFFVLSAKNSNFWSSGTEAWQKSWQKSCAPIFSIDNLQKWEDSEYASIYASIV